MGIQGLNRGIRNTSVWAFFDLKAIEDFQRAGRSSLDGFVKSILRTTLSILGKKHSICSASRNANCLRALARVERYASLRVSILAEHLECAQNAHGERKIDFLRDHLP